MDYEIRRDGDKLWKHSINRKGRVLEAGSRVTPAEAERMVDAGEARWHPASAHGHNVRVTPEHFGRTYAEDVRRRADAGEQIQPRDWNHAMNRDD